ncbi:MAG: DNA translocase FtsK [Muribaculaceae bacterium]|nr:DNA translocase FtsK [Muribaculaceae bacterium]
MTENRKRNHYEDSYTPVFDILEQDTPEPANTSGLPEMPKNQEEPVAVPNRERTVKSKRKRKPEPKKKKVEAEPHATRVRAERLKIEPSRTWEAIKGFFTSQTTRWLVGIFLGGFGVYLLVAFISYFANCLHDQATISNTAVGSLPPVNNAGGEGGARLAELLINESFGLGSFVIIVWLIAIAMKLLAGQPRFKTVNFTIKCIVALITVSLIIGLLTIGFNSGVNWGGYHGRFVNDFIIRFFGWTGAVILCLALVATFFVICLRDFVNWILRKRAQLAEKRRKAAELKAERERREREIEEMLHQERLDAIRAGEAAAPVEDESGEAGSVTIDLASTMPVDSYEPTAGAADSAESNLNLAIQGYEIEDEEEPIGHPAIAANAAIGNQEQSEGSESSESYDVMDKSDTSAGTYNSDRTDNSDDISNSDKSDKSDNSESDVDSDKSDGTDNSDTPEDDLGMVVNVNQISQADKREVRRAQDGGGGSIKHLYKFPSPMILREGEQKMTVDIEEQAQNKERIRETLKYFQIPITSIEATVGPTITLYEIRPAQGIKISKIKNLADDIALSLAAKGVRIIAPIPGRGTVGIEVANAEPQTVSMRSIIMSKKYTETNYKLPVAIGSTIGNDVYMADLAKMPHLLVAGATGQGKSVGLNAIIASLLYKKRPDELKFVMIDPKEVEFSLYAKIEQHYLAKLEDSEAIITDMSKVVDTLNSLCVEMDNRYKLLKMAHVREVVEYNNKIAQGQLSPEEGHRFMPYIVLVVDEFADLIMTAGKEVETPIARLAQKARAVGMHVIIATQRPSTNVITGLIKANFPARIAFKVSSGIDSKTILDSTGAQALIGRGDMLISHNSESVRVQCAFLDTPEVEAICDHISRQPFNAGPYILPEPISASDGDSESGGGSITGGERDPLFEEVGELVVSSGMGSTSGIQRRYSIGYNRAGKIMDQLEHYGVVGPSLGGKPRQVLMDLYGFQELLRTLNNQ